MATRPMSMSAQHGDHLCRSAMGTLCIPNCMIRYAFRFVAVWLLIITSLAQHLWQSVYPLVYPLLVIYYTEVDPNDITLIGILRQYARTVLMMWMLAYKAAKTIFDVTTTPVRDHLKELCAWFRKLQDDYEQKNCPAEDQPQEPAQRANDPPPLE